MSSSIYEWLTSLTLLTYRPLPLAPNLVLANQMATPWNGTLKKTILIGLLYRHLWLGLLFLDPSTEKCSFGEPHPRNLSFSPKKPKFWHFYSKTRAEITRKTDLNKQNVLKNKNFYHFLPKKWTFLSGKTQKTEISTKNCSKFDQ